MTLIQTFKPQEMMVANLETHTASTLAKLLRETMRSQTMMKDHKITFKAFRLSIELKNQTTKTSLDIDG